jgi:alpha-D-xyloside xylohydrolase
MMRVLLLCCAFALLPTCNCAAPPKPSPVTVTSGGTSVRVSLSPFSLELANTRTSQTEACPPLFVDVRPVGDSGGFPKPEAPAEELIRFGSADAVVRKEDPLTLEVTLQRLDVDSESDDADDTRRAVVVIAPDAEDFVSVEVVFDVPERDIAFVGGCFNFAFTEHAVGGGERFDAVDLRSRIVPLYFAAPRPSESGTNEAHVPVPFVATTRGLGLFVQTERAGAFDVAVTHSDALELRFHGNGLPLRIRAGAIVQNVAAYARYAGLPPRPSRLALAPMQWRNSLDPVVEDGVVVRSGTELLLDDVEQMRARGFPASLVWIDAPWETGYNTFVENTVQLPNLDDAIEALRARGFKAIVWATEHLNTSDDSEQMIGMPEFGSRELARAFEDDGLLVLTENGQPFEFPWGRGRGTFVDFTNPAACSAYRAQMRPLIARGIRGFKLDYGETMRPDLLGLQNDVPRFASGAGTRTMHTTYARLYHECFIDELRAQYDDDWFVITRTGGIHDQRNGTAIWPGDLDASFVPGGLETVDGLTVGGLPAAVAGLLSLAMSGYPLYGSDVGGYRGDAPSPELLLRWAQFGAFSPVMQVGGGKNFAPWDAGYEGVVDDIIASARMRMQLWPNWEVWLARASRDGTPIAVPVGVLAGEDERAWADVASYVLGDVLLVAPVIGDQERTRELFVPAGRWVAVTLDNSGAFSLGSEVLEGPGLATVDAPLSRTLVFAKEGGTLTLADPRLQSVLPTDVVDDGGFNFYGDILPFNVELP